MTVKQVSVGLTYMVKFGDKESPVTLISDCTYGGWYGRDHDTGTKVRIKSAGRLLKQVPGPNNVEEGAAAPADSNTATLTVTPEGAKQVEKATNGNVTAEAIAAARRADNRNAGNHNVQEDTTMGKTTVKATPSANSRRNAARLAKQAERLAADTTDTAVDMTEAITNELESIVRKISANKPAAAKPKAKPTAKRKPAATPRKANGQIAAKPKAKPVAKAKPAAKRTTVRIAKPEPTIGQPVTVTLKLKAEKRNSVQFSFQGTAKLPILTGVYVTYEGIDALNEDGKLEMAFTKFDGNQPKNSMRFAPVGDSPVTALYVMRDAAKKAGITEDSNLAVIVKPKSENEITFAVAIIG
jgi:hypothetical protein